MKKYQITEDVIKQIIQWAHDYGRSEQFNYGMFGPNCEQAKHFTTEKAIEYINQHIISNLCEQ